MTEQYIPDVSTAFDILLEEIELDIDSITTSNIHASEKHDIEGARKALEKWEQAEILREKVVALREEWEKFSIPVRDSNQKAVKQARKQEKRNLGRLERGLRTPEIEYYHPILQALSELGGSANLNDVLARVKQLMRDRLTAVDYEIYSTSSNLERWNETARWARFSMVNKGLLVQDSPRGIWEISEDGRKVLAEGTYQSTHE